VNVAAADKLIECGSSLSLQLHRPRPQCGAKRPISSRQAAVESTKKECAGRKRKHQRQEPLCRFVDRPLADDPNGPPLEGRSPQLGRREGALTALAGKSNLNDRRQASITQAQQPSSQVKFVWGRVVPALPMLTPGLCAMTCEFDEAGLMCLFAT
jgi:hypothetical protein